MSIMTRAEPYIRFTQWKRPWHASSIGGGFGSYDFDYEWAICEQIRRGDRISIETVPNDIWLGNLYGVDQEEWEERTEISVKDDDRFSTVTHEDIARRVKRRREIKDAYDANMRATRERYAREKAERDAWQAQYKEMRAAELNELREARRKSEEEYYRKLHEKKAKQAEQDRLWREEDARRLREYRAHQAQLAAEDRARREAAIIKTREQADRALREKLQPYVAVNEEVHAILNNHWQCTKCMSTEVQITKDGDDYILGCFNCHGMARGSHATLIGMVLKGRKK